MVKLKVLAFTRYCDLGASSRIRTYQYMEYMRNHGIDFVVSPLLSEKYLSAFYNKQKIDYVSIMNGIYGRVKEIKKASRYDLVWIEKELLPWVPYFVELLILPNTPFLADYDDAIFHNYDLSISWMAKYFLRKKIDKVMSQSTIVTAGNKYLAQRAIEAGARRVEILPSVVDLSKYPGIKEKSPERPFTIGWIGSPSTTKHLMEAESALKHVCRNRGAKIVLIGAGENPFSGLMATLREWNEEREAEEIGNFDVGIMPLPDNPWERGKCGFKLLQYMACGKPVVASPVGVNREIVVDGVNGFLAASREEWIRALERLKTDPEQGRSMGANGRRMVEEKYCLQVTAPRLHRLLFEAAGKA